MPKAFLIRSAAQRNFAYTLMLIFSTDLPAQIFSCRNAIISDTVHPIFPKKIIFDER